MKLDSWLDKILCDFRVKQVLPYIRPHLKVCDLGCGANSTLLNSLTKFLVNRPVGIDLLLPTESNSAIELRSADLNQAVLPMENNEFDFISMLAVLEHLNNYSNVIAECHRALRAEGTLLLTTPAPKSKRILEFLADLGIISAVAIYDHKRYFKPEELRELLQLHNFTNIKVWTVAAGLNTISLATKGP